MFTERTITDPEVLGKEIAKALEHLMVARDAGTDASRRLGHPGG